MLYSEFLKGTRAPETPDTYDQFQIIGQIYEDCEGMTKEEAYRIWKQTYGRELKRRELRQRERLEILAYHVERRPEFDLPPINPDNVNTRRPLSLKFSYLGNEMIAKCIQDDIGSVAVIFCYAVNGEPPTDVLNTKKLSESLCSCIRHHLNYADDEYLLRIAEDGIIRNYSQAEEVVKQLEDQFSTLHSNKTGKAWNGWKGES